jgi:hypothetical protein
MELLVTFASSHAALGAERNLLQDGLKVELIPVPRQIRSDCGFCLLADGGATGTPEADRRLQTLRDCGATGLWRIHETQNDPASRKVKTYERLP